MNRADIQAQKSIISVEALVLDFWKQNKIFEKSVDQRPENNPYVFYDGPPFISGLPHYGHLLGSIAKDIIPRFWTMKGKRVERVWGWDAHGLTVENKVQKKLGIKNRKDIEKFGLEKFTQECYKYTSEVSAEWPWYIDRIGRWVDMEHAYKTIDQNYMESVIWVFKQLYDKGLIYEGVRTSLYCTTCGTPVSNFEVAMDDSYKDVEDPSIVVEFPVTSHGEFNGMHLLAWTTTPWTIPSNRALVVDPEAEYVVIKLKETKPYRILAKKRLAILGKPEEQLTVVKSFMGRDLVGLQYDSPYKFYLTGPNDFKVYEFAGMVNMEEGTGIVHSAPGFGEIDTQMGQACGVSIMQTLDDEGKFIAGTSGENPFTGIYYARANDLIRADLTNRGLLLVDSRIVHRFPYHDRCDTLLIQKAQNSWFIDIQRIKPAMLEQNENINWVPSNIKYGRFKYIIETSPDWCISRNRFWATPMPVWQSDDGDRIVIESIKELEELSGWKIEDLHRPYIDKVVIKKNGKEYHRIPEVLDCWVESGSMPYAQVHYPFENREKFEKSFPGDYICEYAAQVRAWFNVMHRISTAISNSNSFKNVVVTGTLAGNDGRKMSKTYGNYTDPKKVLETYGGDALRLYLMNSPLMLGESANFDEDQLKTKANNVINPLFNSLKFLLLYLPDQLTEKQIADYMSTNSEHILDTWITVRLHETIRDISANLDNYLIPPAVQAVETFVDDLSRWYIRRSRERISAGDVLALGTLYKILVIFSQASAPIIPFISEVVYKSLMPSAQSVHLCDFPSFNQELIEKGTKLITNMQNDRKIVSLVLAQRIEKNIPVRQMLAKVTTSIQVTYEDIVKAEVNVKQIYYVPSDQESIVLDTTLTQDLILEGKKREIIRKIQDLRKVNGFVITDQIDVVIKKDDQSVLVLEEYADELKQKVGARSLIFGDDYAVKKV